MRCPICEHDNPPGGKFCNECGAKIQAAQAEQAPVTPPLDTFDAERAPRELPPLDIDFFDASTPEPQVEPLAQEMYEVRIPAIRVEPPPQDMPDFDSREAKHAPLDAFDIKSTVAKVLAVLSAIPLKKTLMIAVPLLAVIIAAIIFIPLLVGPSIDKVSDSIVFFVDGDTIHVSGNNNSKFTIEGVAGRAQISLDGSKAIVLTDYDRVFGGTLWFVDTSRHYKIAEEVIAFQLADSGNGVAFFTDHDTRNNVAALYLFDTSRRNMTLITEMAVYQGPESMRQISISPNGRSLTYISDYEQALGEFTGYIIVDGRPSERLGRNSYAIAISNGGRSLYFVREADDGVRSLHVRSGRNETRLIDEMSGNEVLILNRDYSQAVFSATERDDYRPFISQNGSERVRLQGSAIEEFVMPQRTQVGGNSMNTVVYGVRSFANSVLLNGDGLAYMDGRFEVTRIVRSSDTDFQAQISDNGRTLLFINSNGHLSSIDPTREGADRREIGRDVIRYVATSDAGAIYFVNDDEELFYVRGNRMPSRIAEDVHPESLTLAYNSGRAFFLLEFSEGTRSGELFFSNNGGRRTRVNRGGDVRLVYATPANIIFETADRDIFRSNGNERFTLFIEDIGR